MNSKVSRSIRWFVGVVLLLPGVTNSQAQDIIFTATLASELQERWPQTAPIVIRRSGGVRAVTLPISFGGIATRSVDYATSAGSSVTIQVRSLSFVV